MSITTKLSDDGTNLDIMITGQFDFNTQQQFREAYQTGTGSPRTYRIDLGRVSYMDSAALGMLNLLRKQVSQNNPRIILERPPESIKKILLAARFDKLFEIES